MEKRQVSNEMYILKLDIKTRDKLQFIQKSIQNKQPGSCVFCGKVFKDEEELKNLHKENSFACESCNMCYQRTLCDTSIHSKHNFVSK